MDKETIIRYAPFVVVCISLLLQWNMFVTPAQLEVKHREILQYIADKYTTKEDVADMRQKIDKIYDIIVLRGGSSNK